jgi:hypothetical protein
VAAAAGIGGGAGGSATSAAKVSCSRLRSGGFSARAGSSVALPAAATARGATERGAAGARATSVAPALGVGTGARLGSLRARPLVRVSSSFRSSLPAPSMTACRACSARAACAGRAGRPADPASPALAAAARCAGALCGLTAGTAPAAALPDPPHPTSAVSPSSAAAISTGPEQPLRSRGTTISTYPWCRWASTLPRPPASSQLRLSARTRVPPRNRNRRPSSTLAWARSGSIAPSPRTSTRRCAGSRVARTSDTTTEAPAACAAVACVAITNTTTTAAERHDVAEDLKAFGLQTFGNMRMRPSLAVPGPPPAPPI